MPEPQQYEHARQLVGDWLEQNHIGRRLTPHEIYDLIVRVESALRTGRES